MVRRAIHARNTFFSLQKNIKHRSMSIKTFPEAKYIAVLFIKYFWEGFIDKPIWSDEKSPFVKMEN